MARLVRGGRALLRVRITHHTPLATYKLSSVFAIMQETIDIWRDSRYNMYVGVGSTFHPLQSTNTTVASDEAALRAVLLLVLRRRKVAEWTLHFTTIKMSHDA